MPVKHGEILKSLPKELKLLENGSVDISSINLEGLNKMPEVCQKIFVTLLANVNAKTWTTRDYKETRSALLLFDDVTVKNNVDNLVSLLNTPKEELIELAINFLPPSKDSEEYIADGKVSVKDIINVVKHIHASAHSLVYDASLKGLDRNADFSQELDQEVGRRLAELKDFMETKKCAEDSFVSSIYKTFDEKFSDMKNVNVFKGFIDYEKEQIARNVYYALSSYRNRKYSTMMRREDRIFSQGCAKSIAKNAAGIYKRKTRIQFEQ